MSTMWEIARTNHVCEFNYPENRHVCPCRKRQRKTGITGIEHTGFAIQDYRTSIPVRHLRLCRSNLHCQGFPMLPMKEKLELYIDAYKYTNNLLTNSSQQNSIGLRVRPLLTKKNPQDWKETSSIWPDCTIKVGSSCWITDIDWTRISQSFGFGVSLIRVLFEQPHTAKQKYGYNQCDSHF